MPHHSVSELMRRRGVVDMMLTSHSLLRDKYATRAVVLDLIGLVLSVILCLFTFVDPAILTALHLPDSEARLVLGLAASAVFVVSLVQLRVDWKSRSTNHEKAVDRLIRAKALYRRAQQEHEVNPSSTVLAAAFHDADALLEGITPIPDEQFLALKAKHRRKVTLSRLLDRYPGASVWVVQTVMWYRHSLRAVKDPATMADNKAPE